MVIVSLLFIIPIAGIIFAPADNIIKTERRAFEPLPKTFDKYFFTRFGYFISDHALFRVPVMDFAYPYFAKYFRSFDLDPQAHTIKGKDGFWFLGNRQENVLYQHAIPLNPNAAPGYARLLREINYIKAQTGLPLKIFIVPDKIGLYSELLPPFAQLGKVRLINAFINAARANGIEVYDSMSDLQAFKATTKYPLYYRCDSHWNRLGAYVGYQGFMHSINGQPIKVIFSPEPFRRTGDVMTYDISEDFDYTDNFAAHSPQKLDITMSLDKGSTPVKITDLAPTEALRYYTPIFDNPSAPYNYTVLLITDSTSEASLTYFAATFKKLIVSEHYLPPVQQYVDLAKKYKADFIVYQLMERVIGFGQYKRQASTQDNITK